VGDRNRSSQRGIWHTFAEAHQASLIYKATGNLRAVQILLGRTKVENTVRYLGVDVEDALKLAEHTEV
jgi:site-specific recombinase XerC